MPDDAFQELIDRARCGEAAAISELVRQYEPEVRTVARLRLGPALRPYLDSMDLVQSVHRSLIRGLQDERFSFLGPEQLIGLALTMVRRKAARAWRRQRRQLRTGGVSEEHLGELFLHLSNHQVSPGEEAEYNDAVAKLSADLDPLDRQLLELNLLGYRTSEIARLLGRDPDVLRVRLSRLRQRLRATPLAAAMS